jgi:hypothetical protein
MMSVSYKFSRMQARIVYDWKKWRFGSRYARTGTINMPGPFLLTIMVIF